MPKLHLTELHNLSNTWHALIRILCVGNRRTIKLTHGIHTEATYTAGEGFLTSCLDFLTILIASFPVEKIPSTISLRLRVPLAEGNVLVLESSPEGAPMVPWNETLASLWLAPREEEKGEVASVRV